MTDQYGPCRPSSSRVFTVHGVLVGITFARLFGACQFAITDNIHPVGSCGTLDGTGCLFRFDQASGELECQILTTERDNSVGKIDFKSSRTVDRNFGLPERALAGAEG